MKMNKKEAQALYQKYLQGECSQEEVALLQTAFNRYLKSRELLPDEKQILDAQQPMKQAIYERIPEFHTKRRHPWYPYAVAAMALVAGLMALFIWKGTNTHTTNPDLTHTSIEPQIAPGVSKATLILTNGQEIDLSAAHDGIVISDSIRYADGTELSGIDWQREATDYAGKTGTPALRYLTLHTPKGGEYHVQLEDGTQVWLNAESSLQYPMNFNQTGRVVKIQGEAYFEVAHDARPFTVVSDLGEVQVHGTVFNVKAYPEEEAMQTTLVSGSVSLATMRMQVRMRPGELAIADISGHVEKRKVDVAEQIGWKNGLYIFRERRLEDIMRELARWYDFKIRYESDVVKNIAFTGNLKRYSSINDFLKLLKRTGEIEYSIQGDELVLYRK